MDRSGLDQSILLESAAVLHDICLDPGFLNLLTYLINQFLHISFSDILAQGYLLYQIIIGFRFKIFQ